MPPKKSDDLIDRLCRKQLHGDVRPGTYRNIARNGFLDTTKKKNKTAKQLCKTNCKMDIKTTVYIGNFGR